MARGRTEDEQVLPAAGSSGAAAGPAPRRGLVGRVRNLVDAIRDGDDDTVQRAVLQLSGKRRWLAPLALAVGAVAMLFTGLRLLVTNWRLTLIQVLPAMWVWFALLDLKVHAFRGRSFHVLEGPVVILAVAGVTVITMACFFLNAVFAFAIAKPGPPKIRPAFAEARAHLAAVLAWGFTVGLALGIASIVFARWGRWWFTVSMSVVVGVLMLTYVAVPSRLIGVKPSASTRDRLTASAVGGAVGAIVCSPPYLIGRLGLVLLGSHALFPLGVILLVIGITLQAGVTGAVKAVKMSAKLIGGQTLTPAPAGVEPDPPPAAATRPETAAPR